MFEVPIPPGFVASVSSHWVLYAPVFVVPSSVAPNVPDVVPTT